jgi:NAD(P)H dehydrogenase (quinone)
VGKVLVLYDSATGNTRKMAELVAKGARKVPGTEVRLKSVDEARPEDILWCDGLAVGSPTNMGVLSWKMKRFWDETVVTFGAKWTAKLLALSRRRVAGEAAPNWRAFRS